MGWQFHWLLLYLYHYRVSTLWFETETAAEIRDAVKEYRAFIWGLISIVLIMTLIGTKLTQLLPFGETVTTHVDENGNSTLARSGSDIVGPREFLLGLEIYYISPCAVASGIVFGKLYNSCQCRDRGGLVDWGGYAHI